MNNSALVRVTMDAHSTKDAQQRVSGVDANPTLLAGPARYHAVELSAEGHVEFERHRLYTDRVMILRRAPYEVGIHFWVSGERVVSRFAHCASPIMRPK